MSPIVEFYADACLITATISLIIGVVAWRKRNIPGALPLALLLFAMAEWAIANALEATVTDVPTKVFWSQVSYLGISTAPVLFFLFGWHYSQRKWLTRRALGGLFVIPIINIMMAWTNNWHHWLWTQFTFSAVHPDFMIYGHGPWYWIVVAYVYGMLTAGIFILAQTFIRTQGPYRRQAGWLLAGSAITIGWNVLYVFDLSPLPGVDLTPIAFSVTGWTIAWSILRSGLFDLAPIAREVLIENMNDAVFVLDAHDRIVDLNPAGAQLIGQKSAALIGQPASVVFRQWGALIQQFHTTQSRRTQVQVEQSKQCLEVSISVLQTHRGQINGRLVIAHDITDRNQAEQEIQRRLMELATLNAISQVTAANLDVETLVNSIGDKLLEILNIQGAHIGLYNPRTKLIHIPFWRIGQERFDNPPRTLSGGLSLQVFNTRRPLVINQDYEQQSAALGESRVKAKSVGLPKAWIGVPMQVGDQMIGMISAAHYEKENVFSDDDVRLWSTIASNLALAIRNAQLYEQVQQLAVTDDLTGLFNRRALFQRGQDEVNRAKRFGHPLTAAMVDIDHFKQVNDTFTHVAGDRVLQAIGESCRKNVRNTDIAARYGGEEFVILLPETDGATALQVIERLRQDIADTLMPITLNQTVRVTVSAGLAVLDADTLTFDDLVHRADLALYQAKQNGRDRAILWSQK